MGMFITDKPEMNVVNVGDEISTNQLQAIQNAVNPSTANRFATYNDVQTSAGTKLTNSINWTGNYNNYYTYQEGDGVLYSNEYYVLKAPIGAAGYTPDGYPSSWTKLIPALGYAGITTPNTFVGVNTFSLSSGASAPLTVTNNGTGNSFVVNDANPDGTPFVVNNSGLVGVGIASPTAALDVAGNVKVTTSGTSTALNILHSSTTTTSHAVLIENRGLGDSIRILDAAADTTCFVVDSSGNVTLGGSLTMASGSFFANAGTPYSSTWIHEIEIKVGASTYRIPARPL